MQTVFAAREKVGEDRFLAKHDRHQSAHARQQTADLLAERIAGKPEVVALVALAPCSDLDALTQWSAEHSEWSAEHSEEQIAWVGHAPDVGRLASQLIGGESNIRFAKGAVAAIRFELVVQPGAGELQWLATAKLLGV